jgi:antibiotic biosynthesis monooxygenase (ABM) superfamily enzyme
MKTQKQKYKIYEHLEHWLRSTTFTDRLKWLEDANAFVRTAVKAKRRKLSLDRQTL